MTTYTYKCINMECDKYEELTEVRHSMHDEALVTCPACGKDTWVRVVGQAQVIFKGDGWPSNCNKGVHHVNGKEKGMKK